MKSVMSRKAKYTEQEFLDAIKSSISIAEVCRKLKLKLAGGTLSHLKKKIKRKNIDTSHFLGQAHRKGIFVIGKELDYRPKTYQLKRALLENDIKYECNICKIDKWRGVEIVLEIDHINGKYYDNRKENLQFLCPNCHSIKSAS